MHRLRVSEKPSSEIRIGGGTEKEIFLHPTSPDLVVGFAVRRSPESVTSRQIKGLYCLTKIAHLLFPRNIPDIKAIDTRSDSTWTIVCERVSHDGRHKILNERVEMILSGREGSISSDLKEKAETAWDEVQADPAVSTLKDEFCGAGLTFDYAPFNYTKRDSSTVLYLDSFVPWWVTNKSDISKKYYDEGKLRTAINTLPSLRDRRQAFKYLEHLNKLYNEDSLAVAQGKIDWISH